MTKYKFLLFILGGLLLTACTVAEAGNSAAQTVVQSAAIAGETETPLPPPVLDSVTATVAMPAFNLPDPNSLPTVNPTATSTAVATATAVPTATPTATATPTPLPTFTPPALPFTSPNEHYWLRRPIADGGTVWTDKAYPYGHTRGGTLRTHHGVEFYVPTGTEVLATASGTVRVAGSDGVFAYGPQANFYGRLIIIEHDSRWQGQPVYTLYAHLSELYVQSGDVVEAQQVIGLSGASGIADGAHLHLEVRVGQNGYDSTRNPLLWLYPFPDRGTIAGRVTWPDGGLVYEAPVTVRRLDAPSNYAATTTYADDGVNGDDNWQENFVLDDIVAGYYEVEVNTGNEKYTQEIWVHGYQTTFVEIVIE